jgi:hypothetical protein
MSLQLLAKQMESKGRDGDSVLVHMTHGEVAGLQKLAESAGGTLTVNPETGLVEANFLKSMLPTIVGLAVGAATMNPMLGAAAGAAVGGYQANRNDQDVGMGMLMGGLGGYGGASMAGGLSAAAPAAVSAAPVSAAGSTVIPGATASVAPTAAASAGNVATQAATTPTIAENFARFGQGFQGMGTEAGRAQALKSMGGSQGVMNAMQMAALPALNAADAYDRTPGPHPLLSTDINRTGGGAFQDIRAFEPAMPRFTAQKGNVFVPTFTAAEGGEVGFFTGGGLSSSAVANRPFIIDPATGNVIPNPNIQRPAPMPFADVGIAGGMGGSGEVGYTPNADFVTPAQQRAYYAENPTMANVTGIGQEIFGMSPLGVAQRMAAPEFVDQQMAMTRQASAPFVDRPFMDQENYNLAKLASLDDPAPIDSGSTSGGADYSRTDADPAGMDYSGYSAADMGLAQGGLLGLAKGGMRSGGFVVPADVVSMVGEGNTDAGYKRIKAMVPGATAIKGKDGGQADTVKTSIEGKQPARVAHGEMYIPPETVKRMGGAKKLYAMMDRVRQQATGSKKQIKPVSLKRAMA